jgi:hypothetical protein
VDGDRKTMAVANRHDFAALTAASRADGGAPFFRRAEAGVDEGLAEIELPSIPQIFRQSLENAQQPTAALPLLKPTMTRLVRG